jgi:hypothetical protein
LSSILIYPGLWTAVEERDCREKIMKYLGEPIDMTSDPLKIKGDTTKEKKTTIMRYGPKCKIID